MTIKEALTAVVQESNQPYAVQYAQAALDLGRSQNSCLVQLDRTPGAVYVGHEVTGKLMTGHELHVQILYVLNNLSGWRGARAREVKAVLKKAVKP